MTAPFTQALMTAQPMTHSEVLTSPKASPCTSPQGVAGCATKGQLRRGLSFEGATDRVF